MRHTASNRRLHAFRYLQYRIAYFLFPSHTSAHFIYLGLKRLRLRQGIVTRQEYDESDGRGAEI